jgi:hypothetical protein
MVVHHATLVTSANAENPVFIGVLLYNAALNIPG